jgi:Domain of unknown function (DUF4267)
MDSGQTKRLERSTKIIRLCGLIAGGAMLVIGVRFLVVPEQAAKFFGVGARPSGYELNLAIGLRDLWVGALVIAFAWTRQWLALLLWFGFAAVVCFGDAALVAAHGGRPSAIVFHTVSGLLCSAVAVATFLLLRAPAAPDA